MVILFAVLYLFVFLGIALWFSRTDGYISLVVVFGITGFYYYLSIPLELNLRGEAYIANAGLNYLFPCDAQLKSAFMAVVALVSFTGGIALSGYRLSPEVRESPCNAVFVPRSLLVLAVGSVIVFLGVGSAEAFRGLGGYYEGHAVRHENPMLSQAVQYLLFSAIVIAGTLFQGTFRQRSCAFILTCLVVGWGFYSQQKNPFVQAGIAMMAPYLGRRSRQAGFLVIICLAAVVVIGGLPLFSAYRGGATLDFNRLWREFSVLDTDAAGPAMSLAIATSDEPEFRLGETYLLNFFLLVPRRIWPGRPESLAEQFSVEEMPADRWFPGAGYGFSLLAESYMNFGLAGPVIQYLILGWAIGRWWRFVSDRVGSANPAFWRAFFLCSTYMCMVLMHRGPTSQVVRTMIYYAVIPYVLYVIFDCWFVKYFGMKATATREGRDANSLGSQFSKRSVIVRRLHVPTSPGVEGGGCGNRVAWHRKSGRF